MELLLQMRDGGLWPWIAKTSREIGSSFKPSALVVSLMICVGSLVSASVNAVAQNTFEEWTSTDGRTRMIAFWYPTKIRVWRNASTDYEVRKTKSGEILLRFKEGDTGAVGLYSLSQNKLLNLSDSRWSEGQFEPRIDKHILSLIYPDPEVYADEGKEYLIDLTYEGDYHCDPHAAAIYPKKRFNQKEFGRVLVRINKNPRITTSDKYCVAWMEQQEQIVFAEALAPNIYRLPNGGMLLGDTNFPIVFVNKYARNIADFSFCIGTPDFVYTIINAVDLAEIIEKVEEKYQYRSNHEAYGYFLYANAVRKNIDLMDEVAALVGECSLPTPSGKS